MSIIIFSFTSNGTGIAEKLNKYYTDIGTDIKCYAPDKYLRGEILPLGSLDEAVRSHFLKDNTLIFIGAVGIAVRAIAPFVKDKCQDPAVVVVDERGINVIPILSGHLGGANDIAIAIANLIDANAVITTATDINGKFAVDVFARENNLSISDMTLAKEVSAAVLNSEKIVVTGDNETTLKKLFLTCENAVALDDDKAKSARLAICISYKKNPDIEKRFESVLYLIPKIITLGIGCKKDTQYEYIKPFVEETLSEHCIFKEAIKGIASIDLKKDEQGIVKTAEFLKVPFNTYSAEELKCAKGEFEGSTFVEKVTGVNNVCERAACLLADSGSLIIGKTAKEGMTIAASITGDKKNILIFGGTTEGRELAEKYAHENDKKVVVCTATEYGSHLLPKDSCNIKSVVARLDAGMMKSLIKEENISLVIDATHPYATIVSKNIKEACKDTKTQLEIIKRPSELVDDDRIIYVNSASEAAEYLSSVEGNILSTIGSKELSKLSIIPNYKDRVYARILGTSQMVSKAMSLGYEGRHLICMQGPFSKELNSAMLREFDISYLLTKESGANGGFKEKCESAFDCNATLVVIRRPDTE